MSDTEEYEATISNKIEEVMDNPSLNGMGEDLVITEKPVLDKCIEKPKKPRTEKQKEALRKAQEARKLKSLKKKELDRDYMEDSEYFKRLTPKQRQTLKDMAIERPEVPHKPSVPRGTQKPIYESDPDNSDDEVIVYKKKKAKKKKKQKVVYLSASDSSDEDEALVKQIQKPKKKVVIAEPSMEEPEFSDEEDYYHYQQPTQLTYGSIAKFL
tara:strand:+ start:184 stop:819 length:636 start_codon:yes stop_codon:yes gene_type:complete